MVRTILQVFFDERLYKNLSFETILYTGIKCFQLKGFSSILDICKFATNQKQFLILTSNINYGVRYRNDQGGIFQNA
jgi:hypothetical protein